MQEMGVAVLCVPGVTLLGARSQTGMHIKSREEPVVINASLPCSFGRENAQGSDNTVDHIHMTAKLIQCHQRVRAVPAGMQ